MYLKGGCKELPELGGILFNYQKKACHRRPFMRMLYEHYETEKLAICLDPSNIDLIRDLHQIGTQRGFLRSIANLMIVYFGPRAQDRSYF